MISEFPSPNQPKSQPPYVCRRPFKRVFRFRVMLQEVQPPIWRLIEVPDCYSCWDLHVAITDAFGWLDYHLHEFQIKHPKTGKPLRLGSPDEEGFDDQPPVKPDWQKKLSSLFTLANRTATHLYDFGDGWEHHVELEAIQPREESVTYPRCVAGERAGPPEDCGGVPGYDRLLKIIGNPRHKERREMLAWLGKMKGPKFDPEAFDPVGVQFDDPGQRWKIAFDGGEMTPGMRCWDFFQRNG